MPKAVPYLFFKGKAAEAVEFYKDVFGAEAQTMGFDAMPGAEVSPEQEGLLMHGDVWVGDFRFFVADSPPGFETTPFGNAEICIVGDDLDEVSRWFDGLAAGGQVSQPLEKMFWGDHFGKLDDKFGVQWMFSVGASAEGEG